MLVPAKNEAANLRDCLASVSFAEEIVVVDSASTDGTRTIAEAAGARRSVQFVWNGKFPRKKNWALENIPWQHEWVLIVDADERITPELARRNQEAICRPGRRRILSQSALLVFGRLDKSLRLFSELEYAPVSALAWTI